MFLQKHFLCLCYTCISLLFSETESIIIVSLQHLHNTAINEEYSRDITDWCSMPLKLKYLRVTEQTLWQCVIWNLITTLKVRKTNDLILRVLSPWHHSIGCVGFCLNTTLSLPGVLDTKYHFIGGGRSNSLFQTFVTCKHGEIRICNYMVCRQLGQLTTIF